MTDDFLNDYQRPLPKSAKDDLFRKLKEIEMEETNMTPMTIPATVMRRPAWRSLPFTLASAAAAVLLFLAVVFSLNGRTQQPLQTPLSLSGGLLPDNLQPITPENVANLELLTTLGEGVLYNAADWSPNGSTIAVGSARGILLFNAADLQAAPRLLPFADLYSAVSISEVQYSPDGSQIAAVRGNELHFWDVASGVVEHVYTAEEWINSIDYAPDGSMVALATGYTIYPATNTFMQFIDTNDWSASTPLAVGTLFDDMVYSPDGRYLVYSTNRQYSSQVVAWDVQTQAETAITFPLPAQSYIAALTFVSDGSEMRVVTTTSGVNEAQLWRVPAPARFGDESPTQIGTISAPGMTLSTTSNSRFSEDGRALALSAGDRGISLFDMSTPDAATYLRQVSAEYGKVYFSPDARSVFVHQRNTNYEMSIYDLTAGAYSFPVKQTGYSPRSGIGQLLLVEQADGSIITRDYANGILRLTSLQTGEQRTLDVTFMQEEPISMDVSADGSRLVLAYPNMMRVIDVTSGEAIWTRQHQNVLQEVRRAVVRYGDGWVASIDHEGRIASFWNAETGEPIEPSTLAARAGADEQPVRYAVSIRTAENERGVLVWDMFTGAITREFPRQSLSLTGLTRSAEAVYIYGSSGSDNPGRELTIWDWQTGVLLSNVTTPINAVFPAPGFGALQLTNDHRLMVLGAYQRVVEDTQSPMGNREIRFSFWNVETGEQIGGFMPGINTQDALTFSSDDRLLIAGGPDGLIRIYGVRG